MWTSKLKLKDVSIVIGAPLKTCKMPVRPELVEGRTLINQEFPGSWFDKLTMNGRFLEMPIVLMSVAVIFVPSSIRTDVILPLEVLCDLIIAIMCSRLVRMRFSLFATFVFLFLADLLYCQKYVFSNQSEAAFVISEMLYTGYIISMAVFLHRAAISSHRLSRPDLAVLMLCTVVFGALSFIYVLGPYLVSGSHRSAPFILSSIIYRVVETYVFAISVLLSLKVNRASELYFVLGVMLLCISSLALGYNSGVVAGDTISLHEYGWLYGLFLILFGCAKDTFSTFSTYQHNNWSSIRTKFVFSIFVPNILLVMLMISFGILAISNAFDVTAALFASYALWFISCVIAAPLSNRILDVLVAINSEAPPESHNCRVGQVISKSIGISELDQIVKAYNNKVCNNNELVERIIVEGKEREQLTSLASIGQSTAMVAHDVRKPLASMKALLTALPSIKDDPNELKKIVTTVDRNISQTNAMLNDILEFSRDSTSLDLKENNSSGLITSALGDALRNHPGSNVRIEYNLKHLYALKSDVVRITRVLTNVIDNALDAMTSPQTGKASGALCFETDELKRDGAEFGVIVVSDNGPGIPKGALDRIFDPFFTLGKKGGTGLGLAICHRVISLHGGTIRADNREDGKGARFIIELPLGKDRVGSNESELIRHSSELEQFRIEEAGRVDYGDTANTSEFLRINKERGRKSYLLILDDEPLFRESIRAILNELTQVRDHVKVVEAESAETAFRIFDAREFDYVIADIDLGRGQMNGYDFSQIVLKKYPNTRVLIHSNKRKGEMDRNIRSAASDKFMGFLPKPMRSSELLQFLACKSFEVPSNHRAIEPSNRRKVLVVNDDDSLIVAFKIQLRSPDVQVLSAGNVSDALKRITEQKVDVILSDINLGNDEPTGYDLLKKVREKDKSVPFYMISGYSESDEGPKARDLGATGYLQLPVEGAQLKKTILPGSS